MKTKTTTALFLSFHYDVAYQKTFREYLRTSFDILHAGLDLLNRHPSLVFVVEQVILLEAYWRANPARRAALRQHAREGRLSLAPGLYTMPDVNLPSGECFVRNFEAGRAWTRRHLGVESPVCWMADIFGHHAQIPQLARLCGYEGYMFERGRTGDAEPVFQWEGLDGTRIPAQWESDSYYGLGIPLTSYVRERGMDWVARYVEQVLLDPMRAASPVKDLLLTKIGGDFRRPEESDMRFVKAYNRRAAPYELVFMPPEAYFRAIADRAAANLPVVRGEFNPLMQGCYSSRIRLKQHHRRLEQLAASLELLDVAGRRAGYSPIDEVSMIWRTLCKNAFHDILCGSVTGKALREALREYARAESTAVMALDRAILRHDDGAASRGTGMVVLNALPHVRSELIEVPMRVPGGQKTGAHWLVPVAVPAASIVPVAPLRGRVRGARAEGSVLENARIRAELGENGTIVSLYDKETKREFCDPDRHPPLRTGMNNIALQPDQGDLWNPGRAPVNGSLLRAAPLYDPMPRSGILPQHEGPIALQAADADAMWWPSVRVAEAGPLRAALEVRYRAPEVRTTLYLHHDEKMIRFVTRFMPRGNRYRLRAIFPTMLRGGAVRASIPFGWIRRPDGEYPAQDWLEYARDGHGLLLLNRGLPGNNVTDGVLMLSLFRAVAMEDRDAEPWYEEGVEQVFEYALRPFGPRERGYDPVREAERYVRPLRVVRVPKGAPVPGLASLVRVVAGTIAVSSLREVDGEVEVRVYETSGHASDAALSFSHPVEGCRSVDFRGRSAARGRVQADGKCLRLALEAFQVMTLRFKWKGFP